MSSEETQLSPEASLADVLARVVASEDNARLQSMTGLLNSFNFAVQVHSGRNHWNERDFRMFAISLCAMDQIGKEGKATFEHDR